MLLIPCPWCGPREETEFRYGAQADVAYPAEPESLTDEEWSAYLFVRANPEGELRERWFHTAGCRRWLTVTRDTVTNEITTPATPSGPAPAPPASRPASPPRRPRPSRRGTTGRERPTAAAAGSGVTASAEAAHPTSPPSTAGYGGQRDAGGVRHDAVGGRQDGGGDGRGGDGEGGTARDHPGDAPAGPGVAFVFDGRAYRAHEGEPLASALLRNGVRVVGRGPSGRPRGVYGHGLGEPNAYVRVEGGEPMACATRLPVYDGLRARPLAGKAVLDGEPDPGRYDHRWAHCDVLVVGAGPAGLAAAHAAGASGARVILAFDGTRPGGGLRGAAARLDGRPATDWASRVAAELRDMPEVTVLPRTAVTGAYDHGMYVAAQRLTDDPSAPAHVTRQRLWRIRARRVVLATGAYERPVVFPGNDRPGVMSASAVARYAAEGALPHHRAVIFTTNDDAHHVATSLTAAGVEPAAVVDVRAGAPATGVPVWRGCAVVGTEGDHDGVLAAVWVAPVDPDGRVTGDAVRIACDLLAVSGGHDPATALFTQAGGRTRWSDVDAAFLPVAGTGAAECAGAARGTRDLADALAQGAEAGADAAAACGFPPGPCALPCTDSASRPAPPVAFWFVTPRPPSGADGRNPPPPDATHDRTGPARAAPGEDPDAEAYVDLHRDVTLADVRRALAHGMRHIEHVKRYTTAGTGADQGRTCGTLLAGVRAALLGEPVGGTTTARPPVAPLPFALVAGRDVGDAYAPIRRTPMHAWHVSHGAVFENVGQWKRPWYYPRDGEDMDAAVARECRAARESVAVLDYSTLGKIDLRGSDTPRFLDRVYTNRFATLKVGRARYGVMCGADGMVADDGVTARLAEDHFHMTTTTGNAAAVLDAIDEWRHEWPDLDVRATSVTEQWAVISLVGPRAGEVLADLSPDADLSAFGFMTFRELPVAGVPARVFRVSFTGELTYEINVPWWHGAAVWRAVLAAGVPYGITPYGTETMHVLRAEKGLIVAGQETDGTVTAEDAGLGWALSSVKDFVGRRSLRRADTAAPGRRRLVGLLPHDPSRRIAEGAQLVADPSASPPPLGHVTSAYRSVTLGRAFALALLADGPARHDATVYAVDGDAIIPVTVTDPVFYDRDNTRRDGPPAAPAEEAAT